MSSEFSIFLNGEITYEEICDLLHSFFSISLTDRIRKGDNFLHLQLMNIHITCVNDVPYEDESGIFFSKFNYEISFKTYGGGPAPQYYYELCLLLAKIFAEEIYTMFKCNFMLIEDLQIKLLEKP